MDTAALWSDNDCFQSDPEGKKEIRHQRNPKLCLALWFQHKIDMLYVPTPEEIRVTRECMREGLLYRSLPFSTLGMIITQILIHRGVLTSHPRFGSIPKLAFAGLCGWFAGKLSYVKICQEKLKKLENSPLGEALRKRDSKYRPQQSEFSSLSSPLESAPAAERPRAPRYYGPMPFSSSMNESTPTGITDSIPSEPELLLEESPKKKGITYEELRSRNREGYEAGTLQKSEIPLKPSPLKEKVKVNKYGDAWEE